MIKFKYMDTSNTTLIKDKKMYYDLLAVSEYINDLINYCEQCYKEYRNKVAEDEAKNEQLRYDYQEFSYKESYSAAFGIQVYDAVNSFIDFSSLEEYQAAVTKRIFTAPKHIKVSLNISFRSGKSGNFTEHKRVFEIWFEQNRSYFAYESNEDDESFNSIRQAIEEKLDQFPAVRTIFSPSEA